MDGAKTVRLFGEEIAVKARVHTLGGFSAHADPKGLLDWLSHVKNPRLEVFVNHGEEKTSLGLSQLVNTRFHFKASVPEWREKKLLFGDAGEEMPEEEGKGTMPPEEPLAVLLNRLDRTYKKLRRKLKKEKKKGEEAERPRWSRQLEEVHQRLEELEKEIE